MATPTATIYAKAEGFVMNGGRPAVVGGIMAARPEPGMLKSVHLNTLSSLNPCPADNCWYSGSTKQNGPWSNWNGAVFAPDFSEFGAMVFFGGGHLGYDGTEHYIFDLTTQLWSRIGKIVPTDFLPLVDPVWCDYLYDGSYVAPASHTYGHPVYLPSGPGVGVKGAFCLPFNVYSEYGVSGNLQPHATDLITGISTRLTANTLNISGGNYGACWIDTTRSMLWAMPGNGTTAHAKIDLTQTDKTAVAVGGFYSPGYYYTPCYVEAKDMMIAAWVDYGASTLKVAGFDLATGTPVEFAVTLSTPIPAIGGVGFDWCPDTGKFYVYQGLGGDTVYTLQPGANWKSGAWAVGSEVMGGETPADIVEVVPGTQGGQPFTKWKYNPALKCFMWSQGTAVRISPDGTSRNGAFQLYRPLGT